MSTCQFMPAKRSALSNLLLLGYSLASWIICSLGSQKLQEQANKLIYYSLSQNLPATIF